MPCSNYTEELIDLKDAYMYLSQTTVNRIFDIIEYSNNSLPRVLSLDEIKTLFPQAKIITDKYRVIRQVMWAFEKVRKSERLRQAYFLKNEFHKFMDCKSHEKARKQL